MTRRSHPSLGLIAFALCACSDKADRGNAPRADDRTRAERSPRPPDASTEAAALNGDVEMLRRELVSIRTLDPTDEEFTDLRPLRTALANVRIVQLGEQTHGDGATFEAKVRLIKFLHQELGFSGVAFESGFYDCAKAWEDIVRGGDATATIQKAVFPLWSQSAQVQPLWDYIAASARSSRPLVLAGFDSQFTGEHSLQLEQDIAKATSMPAQAALLRDVIAPIELDAKQRDRTRRAIKTLTARVAGKNGAWWTQVLRSTLAEAENTWAAQDAGIFGALSGDSNNGRDRQMAENLIWLATNRFPTEKLIVWGATMHLARSLPELEEDGLFGRSRPYSGLVNMGHIVAEAFGPKVYTIGFLAHEGEWAFAGGGPMSGVVPPSPKGSFDDLFVRAGADIALLELRGKAHWQPTRVARPMGYHAMRGDWTRVVDAFFFIRQMTASTASGERRRGAGSSR